MGTGVGGRLAGGLSEPVVLRVPRGLAVVGAAALIGLIVLSFAVGQRRGYGAGEAAERLRLQEEVNAISRLAGRQATGALGGVSGGGAWPGGGAAEGGAGEGYKEPRRRGMRYFVVSHGPTEEAERLIVFMDRYGVDAAAVPSDNPRFVKVIATQGFTSEALRSPTGRDYEKALRQIGRWWQDANGGGKDLSDLYTELYEG
jgi:hypothetical protein